VSARHAHLRREKEGWRLQDLRSTNGTAVNFEPLEPGEERAVAPGDLLTVGKSHLLLRQAGGRLS
jgi:pSer/pThr/pTyr-binding forkhead associated (FHA) protein